MCVSTKHPPSLFSMYNVRSAICPTAVCAMYRGLGVTVHPVAIVQIAAIVQLFRCAIVQIAAIVQLYR